MKRKDNTDITGFEIKKLPYIKPTNVSGTSRYKKKDLGKIDKDVVTYLRFKRK